MRLPPTVASSQLVTGTVCRQGVDGHMIALQTPVCNAIRRLRAILAGSDARLVALPRLEPPNTCAICHSIVVKGEESAINQPGGPGAGWGERMGASVRHPRMWTNKVFLL